MADCHVIYPSRPNNCQNSHTRKSIAVVLHLIGALWSVCPQRSQEKVQLEAAEQQLRGAWAKADNELWAPHSGPSPRPCSRPDPTHRHRSLSAQQQLLRAEISQLQVEACERGRDESAQLFARVSQLDKELEQAEEELAQELVQAHNRASVASQGRGKGSRVTELESKIASLENEVQVLLNKFGRFEITGSNSEPVADTSRPYLGYSHSCNKGHKSHINGNKSNRINRISPTSICPQIHSKVSKVPIKPLNGLAEDVRRPMYYEKEQDAIESSMRAREEVLKNYQDHR